MSVLTAFIFRAEYRIPGFAYKNLSGFSAKNSMRYPQFSKNIVSYTIKKNSTFTGAYDK